MYVHPCWGTTRGHKRESDALELEPWAFVSCPMGAGNQAWVPYKTASSSPECIFKNLISSGVIDTYC